MCVIWVTLDMGDVGSVGSVRSMSVCMMTMMSIMMSFAASTVTVTDNAVFTMVIHTVVSRHSCW